MLREDENRIVKYSIKAREDRKNRRGGEETKIKNIRVLNTKQRKIWQMNKYYSNYMNNYFKCQSSKFTCLSKQIQTQDPTIYCQ